LHARTLAPSILSLLEAPAEGFFWNLTEFGCRIGFDVFHGCETCLHEAHFQSREEPKVTRSEIRRVRWLGDDRNACAMQFRRKWCDKWFLHHNNAPNHTSLVVQQFLTEKSIPVITQPPYSPDLTLSDIWLFSTMKMGHKGTRFPTMEHIKSNATAELRKIP